MNGEKQVINPSLQYIFDQKEDRQDDVYGKVLSFIRESTVIKEESYKDNDAILGRIKAVLMVLNEKSQNGTFYDDKWYSKAIENNENFQRRLSKKLILGELDHPEIAGTSGKAVAFAVVSIWREGNTVWGMLEIFNTSTGRDLWTLIKAGVVIGFSLRGLGDDSYKDGMMVIKGENFELKGWDAVIDPSFATAEFKEFTESRKTEMIKTLEENDNKESISHKILENLNNMKKEEIKVKQDEFENKQLRIKLESLQDVIKKQNETITKLNEENKKMNKQYLESQEILSQKNKILESKEKTINSYKEEIKKNENKILILSSEIDDKKLLVEKYKNIADDVNYKSQEDKVKIFVEKVNSGKNEKSESYITKSIKSRQYQVK